MSNRRVKSLEYEDDDLDYDDYDEDEQQDELSSEDKEQLRLGTIEVRKQLGPAFDMFVGDTEIQDALWNYYYDISKSVAFIKGKHKPKQNVKPPPSQLYQFKSATGFFDDCPWGQISQDRQAFIQAPVMPPGGLLGGASREGGKMSKLAALAAKRRQKEAQKDSETAVRDDQPQDEYAQRLDALSISSKPRDRKSSTKDKQDIDIADIAAQPLDTGEANRTPERKDEDEPMVTRSSASPFAGVIVDSRKDQYSSIDPDMLKSPSSFDFQDPTKPTPSKQPKAQPRTTNGVINGVQQLNIGEPATAQPKVKSKNIDVLAEYRKTEHKNAANFVVIGHVDSGKSTLMGRLLFDLGAIDQRTIDKYKKDAEAMGKGSFAFAWVLDSGTEERERGVTMDIAANKFDTEKTSFTILDAPGHQDFVPNMIAGAAQADFAVLVIDSSPNGFESGLRGQTKEHAILAKSIGLQRLIVAVNKMDTVQWSKDRFEEIKTQMSSLLKSIRFNLESITFVPCSGLLGENILKPVSSPTASWYKGETLVQALDAFEPVAHNIDRPLRMTVDNVYKSGAQAAVTISGRIEAGSLQIGDQILVQPSAETASIRALDIEADDSDNINEWAVAGQNVTLHLTDIDVTNSTPVRPGDIISNATQFPLATKKSFTMHILTFGHIFPQYVEIHRGRLNVPGKISKLVGLLDKKTGEVTKKRPQMVKPEEAARVVIEVEDAKGIPIESGNRVVLRANGQTIAAGLVE